MSRISPDTGAPASRGVPSAMGPDGTGTARRDGMWRLLGVLGLATLLQWSGAFAIAPILPLYLQDRNISESGVGIVMAAFFVGALLSQYAAGRSAAVRGHRPVLVAGLAAYATGCLGLFVSTGIGMDAAMRVLQGAGAGAFEVAVLTAVAGTVPPAVQGRAFSTVYTGQLVGIAIGPLIGGLAGAAHMDVLFLTSGVAAVLAAVPVLYLLAPDGSAAPTRSVRSVRSGRLARSPRSVRLARLSRPAAPSVPPAPLAPSAPGRRESSTGPVDAALAASPRPRLLTPGLVGLLLVAASGGLTVGTYETCWSLLLAREGASSELIGLTFTLFALPYLVFAWPAGWLADRFDRRWLVGSTTLVLAFTVASYPFLDSFLVIVLVSCVEAVGLAIGFPAAQSLLAQESAAGNGLGRGQGLFASTQTATTAFAALVSGALFAVDRHLPFVLTAIIPVITVMLLPRLWGQVVGTVAPGTTPVPPSAPPAISAVPSSAVAGSPVPGPAVAGSPVAGSPVTGPAVTGRARGPAGPVDPAGPSKPAA